jgi:hypothetical protein
MKVSKRELQRIIREEKVRLRREDTLSASRNSGSISGDAGKKSRANRLRRLKEQVTTYGGAAGDVEPLVDELLGILQIRLIINEEKAKLLNEQSAPQQLLEELEEVLYKIKQFYLKMDYSDDPAMIQSAIASVISAEVEGFMEENLPHRAQY